MKKIAMLLFSFVLLLSACEDDCPGDVNDFGYHPLYDYTKSIMTSYKDKKFIRFRNEQGDTLRFSIKYIDETVDWKFGDTVKDGEVCTEDLIHYQGISTELYMDSEIYFRFRLVAQVDVYGYYKKKTEDGLSCYKFFLDKKTGSYKTGLFGYSLGDNIPIIYKKVKIHGIETEVIDEIANPNTQVYMHDKKGIIAMKIANHGDGFWVVDKVE